MICGEDQLVNDTPEVLRLHIKACTFDSEKPGETSRNNTSIGDSRGIGEANIYSKQKLEKYSEQHLAKGCFAEHICYFLRIWLFRIAPVYY